MESKTGENFDFGANLLNLREKKLLSQDDLGAAVGKTGSAIGQYERNEIYPRKVTLVKLAKELGVTVAELEGYSNQENLTSNKNSSRWTNSITGKIPFYDAIAVAGLSKLAADQTPTYEPAEFIDAGTWFRTATAAMRIAGDSMFPKYRPGCVIALREVFDKDDIDYGKDYVIETAENRWLKCLTESEKGEEYIRLRSYSSSKDEAGKLIHAARDIHKTKIKRIYRVLGQVLHESGGEDILQRGDAPQMTINLKEK